jgi:hypothetical protein
MVASLSAQDQIASLMADFMPTQILNFKYSESVQNRIEELTIKKKNHSISESDSEELEKYLTYDLLIGLAKARAFQYLQTK